MNRVVDRCEIKNVQHRGFESGSSRHNCNVHLFIEVPVSHVGKWPTLYSLIKYNYLYCILLLFKCFSNYAFMFKPAVGSFIFVLLFFCFRFSLLSSSCSHFY